MIEHYKNNIDCSRVEGCELKNLVTLYKVRTILNTIPYI